MFPRFATRVHLSFPERKEASSKGKRNISSISRSSERYSLSSRRKSSTIVFRSMSLSEGQSKSCETSLSLMVDLPPGEAALEEKKGSGGGKEEGGGKKTGTSTPPFFVQMADWFPSSLCFHSRDSLIST